MHEDIKRFYLDGEVAYQYLSQAKETLERSVEDNMRSKGYVPVLDIDPQLSQNFDPVENIFKLKISMYGVYVGESECKVAGLMYGKPVMKHTPNVKSNPSLTNAT